MDDDRNPFEESDFDEDYRQYREQKARVKAERERVEALASREGQYEETP